MQTQRTKLFRDWFAAIGRGDAAAIVAALSDDIELDLSNNQDDPNPSPPGIRRTRAELAEIVQHQWPRTRGCDSDFVTCWSRTTGP